MGDYKMKSRYNITSKLLIFFNLFIGLGAVYGSTMMFLAPDGHLLRMEALLPYFEALPLHEYLYQDYIFPGIALLLINGIPNLVSSYFIIKKKNCGNIISMVSGVLLNLWIIIQLVIFPSNFLSNTYFIFSFIQFFLAFMTFVFYSQEHMVFDLNNYKNLNKNPKKAVVFFSRVGYTKLLAYEEANKQGATIIEVKAKERTEGTLGFWWCGRFAMHHWPMEIEKIDLSTFDSVTICTPIWVFAISSPIRKLCIDNKNKVKNVSYIINHFNPLIYKSAVKEMDELLSTKHKNATSVTSRIGRVRRIKNILI